MAFFPFPTNDAALQSPYYAGRVSVVDTRKVTIDVPDRCLDGRVSVGKLAVLRAPVPLDEWLVGIVDRIVRQALATRLGDEPADPAPKDGKEPQSGPPPEPTNTVTITLLGTVKAETDSAGEIVHRFTRSLVTVPDIYADCFVLKGEPLKTFMSLLVKSSDSEHALAVGHYTLDSTATAFLDGDKFFQRHAAILGSTGSGKSWTVATILERSARLPSANLIVLDLHGEYSQLSYARQLRVPGPDDLDKPDPGLLFLPHWLMNAEELGAMFVDRSEFTAHNQTMVLQREIERERGKFLEQRKDDDLLRALTVDSPVPFALDKVVATIEALNTEMVQGTRGLKQGDFYGQFGRFLARIERKLKDKRYGFLFQAPSALHTYEAFHGLARQLLDFSADHSRIKVIDFSEVPVDALPIMLGIVARLVYYLQFWMPHDKRHPVALICDEAHLYLPHKQGNPNEERAVEYFQKVAKEGRKYGVSLVVVSQRPSDVNETILSQCNNVVALRLTNSNDRNVVQRLMPESLAALLDVLPILDVGEALVVGDAVLLPSRIQMNKPGQKPISATIDFWTEWNRSGKKPDWKLAAENMRRQRRHPS